MRSLTGLVLVFLITVIQFSVIPISAEPIAIEQQQISISTFLEGRLKYWDSTNTYDISDEIRVEFILSVINESFYGVDQVTVDINRTGNAEELALLYGASNATEASQNIIVDEEKLKELIVAGYQNNTYLKALSGENIMPTFKHVANMLVDYGADETGPDYGYILLVTAPFSVARTLFITALLDENKLPGTTYGVLSYIVFDANLIKGFAEMLKDEANNITYDGIVVVDGIPLHRYNIDIKYVAGIGSYAFMITIQGTILTLPPGETYSFVPLAYELNITHTDYYGAEMYKRYEFLLKGYMNTNYDEFLGEPVVRHYKIIHDGAPIAEISILSWSNNINIGFDPSKNTLTFSNLNNELFIIVMTILDETLDIDLGDIIYIDTLGYGARTTRGEYEGYNNGMVTQYMIMLINSNTVTLNTSAIGEEVQEANLSHDTIDLSTLENIGNVQYAPVGGNIPPGSTSTLSPTTTTTEGSTGEKTTGKDNTATPTTIIATETTSTSTRGLPNLGNIDEIIKYLKTHTIILAAVIVIIILVIAGIVKAVKH